MAMTALPTAQYTIQFVDGSRSKSTTEFHVPFATAVADVFSQGNALIPLVAALTDCAITGHEVTFSYKDPAYVLPVAQSRVENKGEFRWIAENGVQSAMNAIPGIKQSVLLANGFIDNTNVAVLAFLAAALGGAWNDRHGNALAGVHSAMQLFRRTTSRQRPQ